MMESESERAKYVPSLELSRRAGLSLENIFEELTLNATFTTGSTMSRLRLHVSDVRYGLE